MSEQTQATLIFDDDDIVRISLAGREIKILGIVEQIEEANDYV